MKKFLVPDWKQIDFTGPDEGMGKGDKCLIYWESLFWSAPNLYKVI